MLDKRPIGRGVGRTTILKCSGAAGERIFQHRETGPARFEILLSYREEANSQTVGDGIWEKDVKTPMQVELN